jgi:aspartate carbamoyltransferase catalytic subunit
MTSDRLTRARPDLLILAPGPINRGVEMTAEIADCRQSLILDQVTNGLAVRMGVLWLTCGPREPAGARGNDHPVSDARSHG